MSASLLDHFACLEDPRVERNQRHALLDSVLLTVCAVVSGAHGWEAIEEFGREQLDGLRTCGRFDNGAPSHDGIANGVSRLTPKQAQSGVTSVGNGLDPREADVSRRQVVPPAGVAQVLPDQAPADRQGLPVRRLRRLQPALWACSTCPPIRAPLPARVASRRCLGPARRGVG